MDAARYVAVNDGSVSLKFGHAGDQEVVREGDAGVRSVLSRVRIGVLRRAAVGVVVVLAGLMVAISPASAASSTDGTSNTIQLAVRSAVLDQAHDRVVVTAPAAGGLAAGMRFASAEVVTPRLSYTLENVLVELAGSSSSLSLNFTKIEAAFGSAPCMSGVDVCLMEEDGIYPPWG